MPREAFGGHRESAGAPPRVPARGRSDTDPDAPLTAPCGKDRAPRTGPHPQPEPVRLRAMAVVRLECTLAHWDSRYRGRANAGTRAAPRRFQDMMNRARSIARPREPYADQRRWSKKAVRAQASLVTLLRAPCSITPGCPDRPCRTFPGAAAPPLTVIRPPPGRYPAVIRPPSKIQLADRTGSHWHPPQHLPFAKRVPNPTPRLWTSDPGRGEPGSDDRRGRSFPATNGAAAAPTCNVHNLWINLLISMWGREVNG
jgi:hypothetical protein